MESLTFLLTTSFYPPRHIGGDAIHTKQLADLLAGLGHTVKVLVNGDAEKFKHASGGVEDNHEDVDVEVIQTAHPRVHIAQIHLTNRSREIERALERALRETEPDIVHHHNISLFGWYRPRGRWRTLYTAHDYWPICQRNDLLKYGDYLCEKPSCFRCCLASGRPPQLWRAWNGSLGPRFNPDKILAPSEYMASKLGERLAGYGGEIVHCPNFVPDHGFEEGPRSDALLYVGVLSRGKGVRNLVEAAISNKHVTLDVVGTGLEVGALRTIVSKSNTEDRVRILGRVSQETLLRLYRHARALIVPSIWPENAPLVVLEALANGTPVIGTRWGGLPEILDPIDSRLCKDSDELLENLDDLDWVSALSSVCRREWERLYSPTAFLRRYMNILQEA